MKLSLPGTKRSKTLDLQTVLGLLTPGNKGEDVSWSPLTPSPARPLLTRVQSSAHRISTVPESHDAALRWLPRRPGPPESRPYASDNQA